ncbi:MAG: hypothetical protein NTW59_02695 [Candidatus Diapherotrites archaeon]|nr:hypothetical protein [Candidatus Diapherotrites archaeon]
MVGMEKVQVSARGHIFEIQITNEGIGFFEVKSPQEYIRLGTADFTIPRTGDILSIHGSFTVDPKRFGLTESDTSRVERILVGEAERAIFRRNPKIRQVIGNIFDARRMISIDAARLFNPKRGKTQVPARIRFGAGKRQRKRPR